MTLRLVVPDGPLRRPSLELLAAAGLPPAALPSDDVAPSDHVASSGEAAPRVEPTPLDAVVSVVVPTDLASYLTGGAADAGLVPGDLLLERETGLCELLDLRFGRSLLVCAEAPGATVRAERLGRLRVATRHPTLAQAYFTGRRLPTEVVVLDGSLERAALDGLADAVVTLVPPVEGLQDGQGRLGGLAVTGVVAESTVRLVAARGARVLRADELAVLTARLRTLVGEGR